MRLLRSVLIVSLVAFVPLFARGGGGGGGSRGGGGGFRGGGGGGFRGASVGGGFRGGFGGGRYFGGYGGRYYGGFGLGFGFGWPYYGYGFGYPYGYGAYGYPYYDPYYADPYAGSYNYAVPPPSQTYNSQGYNPQPAPPQNTVARSAPAAEPYYHAADFYLIAFNDHTIRAALSYRIDGNQIHWTSREHEDHDAPLASVDRRFSEQINRDRHVEFRLP